MRRTLAMALVCLIALSCLPAKAGGDVVEVVVTLAGDSTLGSEEHIRRNLLSFDSFIAARGYDYPFKKVQSIFAGDDVTVINLEGVFYNHSANRAEKTYNFRGPTDFARILPAGSVEAVFVGNNHIIDYGIQGFRSTIAALEEVSVPWFAATNMLSNTWILEKGGFKVGFTGAYNATFGGFRDQMVKDLQTLKDAGCDAIVAVMHAGAEYSPVRVKSQERLAKWYVENGASVVVGHHPHVVQGMDIIGGVSVVYSLGNFSFGGNAQLRATQALLAQVTLRFSREEGYLGHQVNLIPVSPSGTADYNNYQPVILRGDAARAVIELAQRDTPFELAPYVEGVGALQPFVPAPEPETEPVE
ncbi:MAG: CapA family protein [Eubacteriales bacterium]|nr:CapA family protein [Eubacteriales bacterium]